VGPTVGSEALDTRQLYCPYKEWNSDLPSVEPEAIQTALFPSFNYLRMWTLLECCVIIQTTISRTMIK